MLNSFYKISQIKGVIRVEIYLVVSIFAVLSSVVIVTVNPIQYTSLAQNAQRFIDVNRIGNALYYYAEDHEGKFPVEFPSAKTEICAGSNCTGLVDLSFLVPRYLQKIPRDNGQSGRHSGYAIFINTENSLFIEAIYAESGEQISLLVKKYKCLQVGCF